VRSSLPGPWGIVSNLPLLEDVFPYRFILITYLAVGIMIALITQHTYSTVNRRRSEAIDTSSAQTGSTIWKRTPRWAGAAAGLLVAAVAIVPPAEYLAHNAPIATESIAVPTWFKIVAPHLKGHEVVLTLPYDNFESPLMWQSVETLDYSMINQGGPGDNLARAGKERRAAQALKSLSGTSGKTRQSITGGDVVAIRNALRSWGVTKVVIPDQQTLPAYDKIPSVAAAASVITAATNEIPVRQDGALVWSLPAS
jgi:hypothetical protein